MALTAKWDTVACGETVSGCVRLLNAWKFGGVGFDYQAFNATRGGQVVQGAGLGKPWPLDLLIHSDCTAATGLADQEGALYDEWDRLTDRYDPHDGAVDFETTRPTTTGGTEVRTLTARAASVTPAFFADENAARGAPGMRVGDVGWLLYPVKALVHWPYWAGAVQTDVSLEVSNGGTTDTVVLTNGGVRNCGLKLSIIANDTVTSIKLGNSTTGDEFTIVKGGALTAGEYDSWYYDDPLNHTFTAGWQIAAGGKMELAPGNNNMTLTWLATNGTVSVKLWHQDLYTSP